MLNNSTFRSSEERGLADLEYVFAHPESAPKAEDIPPIRTPPRVLHYTEFNSFLRDCPVDPSSVVLTAEDHFVRYEVDGNAVGVYRQNLKLALEEILRDTLRPRAEQFMMYRYAQMVDTVYREFPLILGNADAPTFVIIKGGSEGGRKEHMASLSKTLNIARLRWPDAAGLGVFIVAEGRESQDTLSLAGLEARLSQPAAPKSAERCYVKECEVSAEAVRRGLISEAEVAAGRLLTLRHAEYNRKLTGRSPRKS